jgi:hypothetical protein
MAEAFKLAYDDAETLQAGVDDYFENLWETRTIKQRTGGGETTEFEEKYMRPPTMAGLARHLGVIRVTLWRYGRDEHSNATLKPVIAGALNRIAEFAEEALYTREGNQGAKFSLEMNHRYGREDEGANAGGFTQNIIIPASIESTAPLAIPEWGEDEEND